jgi:Flp pilus assembly protein TadG
MFYRVLNNRLKASACRFVQDRGGQAALTFALAAVPILGGAGVAIDYARMATKYTSLQQATDSTALAIAQSANTSTTNAMVLAQAQNYVTTNYDNKGATVTAATISTDRSSICVTAQDTVQLGVMSIFQMTSKNITASTCAGIAGGAATYEVALVLDNSGSMAHADSSGTTKISSLKTAANNFISTMYSGNFVNKVKMSIVPFSGTVKVSSTDTASGTASWIDTQGKSSWHWTTFGGATAASTSGFTSRFSIFNKLKAVKTSWAWAGCFETQPYPQNVNDTPPSSGTPDSLYVPYLAPDEVDAKQTCDRYGNCSTTQAYQNNYIADTPSSGCSGTAPTSDQGLLTRACKYKIPSAVSINTNATFGSSTNPYGPNGLCLSPALQRMTATQSTLTSAVNALIADGDTNLHEGLMWGWRTLSPNAPFADGRAYDKSANANNKKILVLMTDGYNNWSPVSNTWGQSLYEALGYFTLANGRLPSGNQSVTTLAQSRAALDELTSEACTNAKAQGIEIYTVGFSTSSDPIDTQGQNLLKACATDDQHAFIANDGTSLVSVFNAIGIGLGKLRIKS